MSWGYFKPYVSVAKRRASAVKEMEKLRKKGADVQPVLLTGRTIASTFWGKAWCQHLEKFSDYENRLPRGRTYVRNGSVCHLEMQKGKIIAKVSGSELYDITISITALASEKWANIKGRCASRIGSLIELLQGKLSSEVMTQVTDQKDGLFPSPTEIKLDCSCPDSAGMCKHIAAVMYGVGARLDKKPELLFLLRGVNHTELVSKGTAAAVLEKGAQTSQRKMDESSLSEVFGIEITPVLESPAKQKSAAKTVKTKSPKQPKAAPVKKESAAIKKKKKAKTKPKAKAGKASKKKAVVGKP
jgi:uncharacterized Zn finger protein